MKYTFMKGCESMIIHTVKNGETLYSISSLYGLTPTFIQSINALPNPENLVVGQSLVILFPKTLHTVTKGETLSSIAEKYSVSTRQLFRNNPFLKGNDILYSGMLIVIEYEEQENSVPVISNAYTYAGLSSGYLKQIMSYLTYIISFTYGINEDGSLIPIDDYIVTETAQMYKTVPLMHLSTLTSTGVFSNALAAAILNNTYLQDKIIENIVKEVKEKGYGGVDIDFEFLPAENSLDYAEFVSKITAEMNRLGFITVVALAPKTSADQPGLLYEGHNYSALSNAADYVFVMTYEWGYTYGPPMAVSPIKSVENVIKYALSEMSSRKIIMGLPSYGYNWTLPYVKGESKAVSISSDEAVMTALKYSAEILFDEYTQTPYFYYTDENMKNHEVWFEDARSAYAKFELLKKYNLAGGGYWNLERPFLQSHMIMNVMFDIEEK